MHPFAFLQEALKIALITIESLIVGAMPMPLPQVLLGETPATKFLFVWLAPQGKVNYTVRQLAEHTGVSYKSVSDGLKRLKVLKLVRETTPPVGPVRRVYAVRRP